MKFITISAPLFFAIHINRNIDEVTWLGDLASVVAETRASSFIESRGLYYNEIQEKEHVWELLLAMGGYSAKNLAVIEDKLGLNSKKWESEHTLESSKTKDDARKVQTTYRFPVESYGRISTCPKKAKIKFTKSWLIKVTRGNFWKPARLI